jgi:predicted phage gp36 major capsid-like protein
MVTTNAPRATTQLTLQRFALTAVEEKWSASRLAREADCNVHTAEKFLSRLADTGMEKTQREVLTLANEYRHTLERTAARSREYLESISHLELDQLDKDQRSLRKDALSSLSSLSSMLRLEITGDSSASAPPRLGNL